MTTTLEQPPLTPAVLAALGLERRRARGRDAALAVVFAAGGALVILRAGLLSVSPRHAEAPVQHVETEP